MAKKICQYLREKVLFLHLDLTDPIFCAQVCPMGIYARAKLCNPSFSGYENFPRKLISVYGRTTLERNSHTSGLKINGSLFCFHGSRLAQNINTIFKIGSSFDTAN